MEENASLRGAFSEIEKVTWTVNAPREFGVCAVLMRINRDGKEFEDLLLSWNDDGTYTINLDMEKLGVGLYYYSFVLLRGRDTLFTNSVDNVNFTLSNKTGKSFLLSVYDKDFTTPDWFKGGIMYQIFPDRFYKSGRSKQDRQNAIYLKDWNEPITQFAAYPGAPVENNYFYGGDLYGIADKIDYLKSIGANTIYLNPIFEAYSNHRYDTADYSKVDEALGGNEALAYLIEKADGAGMRVVLDGVFNHTGDDSIYFNRRGNYGSGGAFRDHNSPYRDWYCFRPDGKYDSWWGIEIMPRLNHYNENCRKFFTGDDGICATYVKNGIAGWRLDVADELCNEFLDDLRRSVKKADRDALIIGEVWENAADKIAYGYRRKYFLGEQLDSVMNYPLRTGIINFLKCGDSEGLARIMTELYACYPKCVSDCLMNIVGTHDTERIISVLGDCDFGGLSNCELACRCMCEPQKNKAVELLKIASVIQYTSYGVPSLYYGDEAGEEGYHDPFCRKPFPWGNENQTLMEHYRMLGKIRCENSVYKDGYFKVLGFEENFIAFERFKGDERIVTLANVGDVPKKTDFAGKDLISGKAFDGEVAPKTAVIVKI